MTCWRMPRGIVFDHIISFGCQAEATAFKIHRRTSQEDFAIYFQQAATNEVQEVVLAMVEPFLQHAQVREERGECGSVGPRESW
jgi:hypothetical protein